MDTNNNRILIESSTFFDGVWYVIQQLVLFHGSLMLAEEILSEANIHGKEAKQLQRNSGFENERMKYFIKGAYTVRK